MTNFDHARFAALATVLLLALTCACAQDWPQWRGIEGDGKVAAFEVPQVWPPAFARQWQVVVGAGDATPGLVGDRLYVFVRQGAEEVTLCLNAADGAELWRDAYPAPAVTGAASQHPGPRGSPAVMDGKVVTLGVVGTLSCLDAATGKLLWRKDEFPGAFPRFYTGVSPIIVNGMVIAHLGGSNNGALMAFDLASGDTKWKWADEGPGYSTPAVLTVGGVQQLAAMTEKSVVGIAVADGKLLWQIPFPTTGMAYNAATPIVDGDTIYITGQGRGTRSVRIEHVDGAFSVKELWANPALGVQYNTPVLKDGYLYGLSERGNLFCLDAKTGETAWLDTIRHGRNFGAILDVGEALFALPDTGMLIIYAPDHVAYRELAKIKVATKQTYAFPVCSGQRIFIKDQDSLMLWTVE